MTMLEWRTCIAPKNERQSYSIFPDGESSKAVDDYQIDKSRVDRLYPGTLAYTSEKTGRTWFWGGFGGAYFSTEKNARILGQLKDGQDVGRWILLRGDGCFEPLQGLSITPNGKAEYLSSLSGRIWNSGLQEILPDEKGIYHLQDSNGHARTAILRNGRLVPSDADGIVSGSSTVKQHRGGYSIPQQTKQTKKPALAVLEGEQGYAEIARLMDASGMLLYEPKKHSIVIMDSTGRVVGKALLDPNNKITPTTRFQLTEAAMYLEGNKASFAL